MKIHIGEVIAAFMYIFLPICLGWGHARLKSRDQFSVILNYALFIGVGIQGLVTGALQMFAPDVVVFYTQWPYSLFLLELGMANFSYGVLGILSVWLSEGWKYASAIGYGLFLFFTGIGHLVDIALNGPTMGSAGAFLFSDLLVPVVLWTFLFLQKRKTSNREEFVKTL